MKSKKQNIKIYIPLDISDIKGFNPYGIQFIESLEKNQCDVIYGLIKAQKLTINYDIIHFQWPEAIFSWKEPSIQELMWLENYLSELKKHAKIVTTIHNEFPHYKNTDNFLELYRIVYKYTNAFVHFGAASIEIINKQYPKETENKIHRIIPHGNYSIFGEIIPKQLARKKLDLPQNKNLVLVIGDVRNNEEMKLIMDSLHYWGSHETKLLFRARYIRTMPSARFGTICKRLSAEINKYFVLASVRRNKNVIFRPGFISNDEMASLLSASDLVLIPRRKVMNSGNLPLGYSFGKIVVGPDVGNVGDILSNTGNIVFDPYSNFECIADKIIEGVKLSKSNRGELNRKLALQEWDWDLLGAKYHNLYKMIL